VALAVVLSPAGVVASSTSGHIPHVETNKRMRPRKTCQRILEEARARERERFGDLVCLFVCLLDLVGGKWKREKVSDRLPKSIMKTGRRNLALRWFQWEDGYSAIA
jgi:DNA-binding transcriptional regulator YbjK